MVTGFANEETLRMQVERWLGACESLKPLERTGRNNRVFKATSGGKSYLCKQYYRADGEAVSLRQSAEMKFARHASETVEGKSPRLLEVEESLGVSLFEFIEGDRLANPIACEEVVDAFDFLLKLNRRVPREISFPDASDSAFSLAQHAGHVRRRLRAYEEMSEGTSATELRTFVVEELKPVEKRATSRLKAFADRSHLDWEANLSAIDRILSPSDFGFHNALKRPSGEVVYLDFEYAGWDDPVKCICDFFSQPDFPAPMKALPSALGMLPAKGNRPVAELVEILMPLYVVKWTCIMLNPFQAQMRTRREFSRSEEISLGEVLLAARRYFSQHESRSLSTWHT